MSSPLYKHDRTISLVTTASPIIQNLALLDAHEDIISDSLAVIHGGFINYIPILNTLRRCKYVGIDTHKKQAKAIIFSAKWFHINEEIFFITLSTLGLHVYDAEVSDQLFTYSFEEMKNPQVIPVGCCVFQDITLCAGLSDGSVYLFQVQSNVFEVVLKCELGESILVVDGNANYFVAISRKAVTFWEYRSVQFYNKTILFKDNLDSEPSVLKTAKFHVVVGLNSGEVICHQLNFKATSECKVYAHNGKVTCIDFSDMKNFMLTGSSDKFVKIWQVDSNNSINLLFSIDMQQEVCGVGFLNFRCVEFCIVKSNTTTVDVYSTDDFDDTYDV